MSFNVNTNPPPRNPGNAALIFAGVQVQVVLPSESEWAAAGFDGTPEAMVLVGIDADVVGSEMCARMPPVAFRPDAAALLIGALEFEFARLGKSVALTAALDQVRAHAKAAQQDTP